MGLVSQHNQTTGSSTSKTEDHVRISIPKFWMNFNFLRRKFSLKILLDSSTVFFEILRKMGSPFNVILLFYVSMLYLNGQSCCLKLVSISIPCQSTVILIGTCLTSQIFSQKFHLEPCCPPYLNLMFTWEEIRLTDMFRAFLPHFGVRNKLHRLIRYWQNQVSFEKNINLITSEANFL